MDNPLGKTGIGLIVTRTPLRVSFAGGGTDLPEFYSLEGGAVLSATINKYVYVTIRHHGELFNERFRLNYSETEQVEKLDEIKNDIARECLRFLKVEPPIYISTVADIPAFSGLGSSSSFAVGLLHALHAYKGEHVTAAQLAQEACHIEIDVLKHPIGKQDQYAAAFGGLNLFRFMPGGEVTLEPHIHGNGNVEVLFRHTMMFWTKIQRCADEVLSEQKRNIGAKRADLLQMRDHAYKVRDLMRSRFDPLELGRLLHETWNLKRQLASKITNDRIDRWYQRALEAGAVGGKLCGAGGGGFLLLIVEPHRQRAVRQTLKEMVEVRVSFETGGSRHLLPIGE